MAGISNWKVYGLEESIYRSGYPMMAEPPTKDEFDEEVKLIRWAIYDGDLADSKHVQRAIKLANAKGGGHDQFLTGIVVNFDLTLSNKAWVEAERYTFLNFISSMSSMHRISAFSIRECCNEHVSEQEIIEAEKLQRMYNAIDGTKYPKEKAQAYLDLLYNIPSGFELMAGMSTNYRCLKNIYAQRRNHRLPDWQIVCDWIEALPLGRYLITGEAVKETLNGNKITVLS